MKKILSALLIALLTFPASAATTTAANSPFNVNGADITPTSVSTGAVTSSVLTSGRCTFATTGGLLTDSAAALCSSAGFNGVLGATTPAAASVTTLASTTGITVTLGTLTADQKPISITSTRNNAAVVFSGITYTITDTASDAASMVLQVLGGAAGTTNLISVSKAGLITAPTLTSTGNIISGGNLTLGGGSNLSFNNSTTFYAPSNGVLLISNFAQTDVGRVLWGGTTSSFPSWKRSGTTLAARLADDSADSPVTASAITASTTLTAGTAVTFSSLTTAAGTPSSICQNAATKEITVNAALTCTVSSRDYKAAIEAFNGRGLQLVMAMRPTTFYYTDNFERPRIGLIAEDLNAVDPRLSEHTAEGKPNSIDFPAVMASLVDAVQQQQAQINELRAR